MSGVVQVKDVEFTYDEYTGIEFPHDNEDWKVTGAKLNKDNTVLLQVEDDGGTKIKYYLVKVNDNNALEELKNQLKRRKLIMKKPSRKVKQMATWKNDNFKIALRL